MKREGSVGVIVLIIVLILFIFGAYYLGSHNIANPLASTSNSVPNSSGGNLYANWKTYKNDSVGFQLKYPSIFGDPIESHSGSFSSVAFFANTPTTTAKTVPGASIFIQVGKPMQGENVQTDIQSYHEGQQLFGSSQNCETPIQMSTTTIQGEAAIRVDCSNGVSNAFIKGTDGPNVALIFYHNGMQFSLAVGGDTSNDDVSGIIQSFSFTK